MGSMLIDNCCGEVPHSPDCIFVTHGTEDEEISLCCDYCGNDEVGTVFLRRLIPIGCDRCIEEVDPADFIERC